LEHYARSQALRVRAESGVPAGAAARYIGETFRTSVGGHWSIDLEDRRNLYFGLPVLIGYARAGGADLAGGAGDSPSEW
jgi:hypothetical protein